MYHIHNKHGDFGNDIKRECGRELYPLSKPNLCTKKEVRLSWLTVVSYTHLSDCFIVSESTCKRISMKKFIPYVYSKVIQASSCKKEFLHSENEGKNTSGRDCTTIFERYVSNREKEGYLR